MITSTSSVRIKVTRDINMENKPIIKKIKYGSAKKFNFSTCITPLKVSIQRTKPTNNKTIENRNLFIIIPLNLKFFVSIA